MKLSIGKTALVESEILKRVRANPGISRVALARKLQIAPSTIGNYTGRLISRGFLIDSEKAEPDYGRPPTALRLNPDGGQFVGVDFEARNIMAISVDFADRPLKKAHLNIKEADSADVVVQKIEEAIAQVLPDEPGRLLAIGVGVPGLVDPVRGIALHYKYINQWNNVPLTDPLQARFGVPVYLENCVRAMALAELWFGQGKAETDWICIGIRSGIGAGIVCGGELQRGSNFRAGEVGRWCAPPLSGTAARFFSTNRSEEMGRSELQEIASVRAMLAALERARLAGESSMLFGQANSLMFADVVRAVQQADPLVMRIIHVIAEALGWAIGNLALTLNPSRVILAGPLTLLGESLLNPLREYAQNFLAATGAAMPVIANSNMGEFNGALGAAALAVHEWKPSKIYD